MSESLTYQKAGVDPEKASQILTDFAQYLKGRPKDPNLIAGIGPFASCYQLGPVLKGLNDPVLVTSCDGVGTKVKLAHEWNDISGLGSDLVGMNVNDVLCAGGRPLFFLDYYACGKLDDQQLTTLLKSIQEGCEIAGMSLAGGETAEMPGIYSSGHFDLAGFVVGIADRNSLLGPQKVADGDVILGLRSTGFHSNGYSLVRAVVEKAGLQPGDKAPFADKSWKELLLAPTKIYVQPILPLLGRIHALAHLTGGGLFENLPRVLPKGSTAVIESSKWKMPTLFRFFQEKAGISETQLLSTFNCGMGMLAIVPVKEADAIQSSLQASGVECQPVGRMELCSSSENPKVVWQ